MCSTETQFEKQILELTESTLNAYLTRFQALGLHAESPKLTRHVNRGKYYQSEIVVDIYSESGLEDVIEFCIWKSGKPYANHHQIKSWLHDTLETLLQSREGLQRS